MARPYNKQTKRDAALLLDICSSSLEQFPLIGAMARDLGIPDGSTPHRLACAAYYAVTCIAPVEYTVSERFAEAAQLIREGWCIGDPISSIATVTTVSKILEQNYPASRIEELVTEQTDTLYRSLIKERIKTNNAVVESGNYPETWRDALAESPGPYPAMSNYEAAMNDPVVVHRDEGPPPGASVEYTSAMFRIPEAAVVEAAGVAGRFDQSDERSEDALDTDTVSIDVVTAAEDVSDGDTAPSVDGFDWNDGVK